MSGKTESVASLNNDMTDAQSRETSAALCLEIIGPVIVWSGTSALNRLDAVGDGVDRKTTKELGRVGRVTIARGAMGVVSTNFALDAKTNWMFRWILGMRCSGYPNATRVVRKSAWVCLDVQNCVSVMEWTWQYH